MEKQLEKRESQDLSKPVALVAGGAGFVGSFLCELLLKKDCRVIAIDSLVTGKKENLDKCFEHSQFTFLKQDLLEPPDGLRKVDYIFHLAGLETYLDRPNISLEVLKVNALGTENLLRLAKRDDAKFLLASSIYLNEIEASGQDLNHYFTSDEIGSKIGNLNEAKRFAEALTNQYYHRQSIDARIVRLGFVYGPRMSLKTGGFFARLMAGVLKEGRVNIPEDRELEVYPTFVADAVFGMVKAMFAAESSGKIFCLLNSDSVKPADLAGNIKDQLRQNLHVNLVAADDYPDLAAGHGAKERMIRRSQASRAALGWQPQINYQEGLSQTLAYFKKHKELTLKIPSFKAKETSFQKLSGRESKKPFKKFFNNFRQDRLKNIFNYFSPRLLVLLLIFGMVFYLPISFCWQTLWGAKSLVQAQSAFEKLDLSKGTKRSLSARRAFSQARGRLDYLSPFFSLTELEELQSRVDKLLTVGERLGSGGYQLGLAAQNGIKLGEAVFQGGEGDPDQLIGQINASLDLAYEQVSLAESEYLSEQWFFNLKIPFKEVRQFLSKADQGLGLIPGLIGLDGERKYLLIFQNNMELRPTGGFIGSFALVDFRSGRLKQFEVSDVYSADGQLKGHVEPPPAIKQYLGEAGWYLRDANWHPDFPTSALGIEWFLDKEIKQKVDGVVALNLFFAQEVIDQFGGVELADFNETITAENLFEKASAYSESGFFPGSTQKRDFLSGLSSTLFEQVKLADKQTWFKIGRAFYRSLDQKEILIFLNQADKQQSVRNLGWDGGIREVKCRSSEATCYLDYLMIVEANVGVNKANYFVKRNLSQQVKVDQKGVVRKILRLDYLNQSQSEVFPSGRYKNYLRILVPKGSKVEKVSVNEKLIRKEEIDKETLAGKTSFGFLVEVPIKGECRVEVHYQLPEKVSGSDPVRYVMFLQKQSGIRDEAFHFWLSVPGDLRIVDFQPRSGDGSDFADQNLRTYLTSPVFDQDILFEAMLVSH